jgi:hypothetical protein
MCCANVQQREQGGGHRPMKGACAPVACRHSVSPTDRP